MPTILSKGKIFFLCAFTLLISSQITYSQDEDSLEHHQVITYDTVDHNIVDPAIQNDHLDGEQHHEEMHANHDDEHAEGEHGEGGHHNDFSALLFVIIALIIGAGTRFALSKIGLPFTVALLIIGLGIGFLGRNEFFLQDFHLFGQSLDFSKLDNSIKWAAHLDAHAILYVFLPILIFEAAFAMDVHIFKKSFTNSVLLAVPGIVIALVLTALCMWLIVDYKLGITTWNWEMVLLFGTVISATDPVAVVAILKELGASKKLGTLIEGESLLNDGTAIVIFMVIFGGLTGNALGYSPFLEFLRVALGGVAVGAVIGYFGLRWMHAVFNDMLIEITIIVALAYLTFFICENTFHVSGVLGLVTLGLIMAGPGRTKISPEVQHFIHEFWEFTAFTANTLIFLIVGVVIAERTHFTMNDVWVLLAVYVIIHLVRAIVIAVLYPLMKRAGYGIGKNHPQVMWWGALRGAIGLALALIVETEPSIPPVIREQFLFLTAGIVTLTLLVNATTMKAVAQKLGLTSVSKTKRYVLDTAKDYVFRETVASIDNLEKDRFFKKVNWEAVGGYLPEDPDASKIQDIDDFKEESRRRILEKEKSSYWSQFKEGLISSSAYNLLVSEINDIIDSGGEKKLSDRGDLDELLDTKNSLRRFGFLKKFLSKRYIERLAASFDVAKGFYTSQQKCLKMLKELQAAAANEREESILKEIEGEIEENNIQALTFLRNFKNQYPNIYRHVSTRQAIRTLLNTEKSKVNELLHAGRITNEEATAMITDIESRMRNLSKEKMTKEDQTREKPKEAV
ncbi:sodium:proton antiporter [Paracrocinitomix mangrovi]|uniref:cation:proton antiporter n=1 Tax=Paracrocinitomix mangrovi TaxID=2862509 RepID=UPI001C8E972C|nr:sodium:proton antiporter [Paracrocinitomix mangrovi]UKN02101.1 sodium:proton antiporter [Paracrocinitomix mangrovi]